MLQTKHAVLCVCNNIFGPIKIPLDLAWTAKDYPEEQINILVNGCFVIHTFILFNSTTSLYWNLHLQWES